MWKKLLKALSSASPHKKYLLENLKSTNASHKKTKENKSGRYVSRLFCFTKANNCLSWRSGRPIDRLLLKYNDGPASKRLPSGSCNFHCPYISIANEIWFCRGCRLKSEARFRPATAVVLMLLLLLFGSVTPQWPCLVPFTDPLCWITPTPLQRRCHKQDKATLILHSNTHSARPRVRWLTSSHQRAKQLWVMLWELFFFPSQTPTHCQTQTTKRSRRNAAIVCLLVHCSFFLNDDPSSLCRPTRRTPRGPPRWRASRSSCRSSWRANRCRRRWPSLSTRGESFVFAERNNQRFSLSPKHHSERFHARWSRGTTEAHQGL